MANPLDLLLANDRDDTASQQCVKLLVDAGFSQPEAALSRMQFLTRDKVILTAGRQCLPVLMTVLSDAFAPDESLVNFERFVSSVADPAELLSYLTENPRGIDILIRLFSGSQFLTEILIQNPHYLRQLTVHSRIAEFKHHHEFQNEAKAVIDASDESALASLRRFHQWELLRIGACDAFGLMDLRSITQQLSFLADSVVRTALKLTAEELKVDASGLAIIAMGKLGGMELNYSSDIDLIFVSASNASRYWKLGQKLIVALTESSPQGFLYRVDMRLRPWGQSGALVNTVDSHIDYLAGHGELWEKQAMLKARVIAGDGRVGRDFLQQVAPLIFTSAPTEIRTDVMASKQKIEAGLKARGTNWGDVKSGRGSIRDIEFTTQYLQLVNGGLVREVRSANTLEGLVRLAELGFLHADEYRILSDAYVFLRTIEHSLQIMHSQQTHSLPTSNRRLGWLARRLDFLGADQLREHYERCCDEVRRIFHKYVRDGKSATEAASTDDDSSTGAHQRKMGQSYSEVFSEQQIQEHARLVDGLTESQPIAVQVEPADKVNDRDRWQLTVIGRDHPGCLSIISGVMLAHGLDIDSGHVFTGIRAESAPGRARRFVDTFRVRSLSEENTQAVLTNCCEKLPTYMQRVYSGEMEDVSTEVLRSVSRAMATREFGEPLSPVNITIDNNINEYFTVLQIESADTTGFLYELTNALTLSGIHIEQVQLNTVGGHVSNTLHISRHDGSRITDERGIQQLRAAIVLIKHFTHLLPQSPSPRRALQQFREFLEGFFKRDNWLEELSSLRRNDVLEALAQLLGVSSFLWMDFLRLQHENLFPVVRDVERLREPRTRDELAADLQRRLRTASDDEEATSQLNAFKDREMFRTDMRHILGHCRFTKFANELTDVAEVVVGAAVRMATDALTTTYGLPQLSASDQPCPFAVCALGSCGGRELGYGSDIELMFVYAGTGKSNGRKSITNAAWCEKLVKRVCSYIETRQDGTFAIDTRLRPYGKAGSAAVEMATFASYFGVDGPAWPYERQALIKLRQIAGDEPFGAELMALRDKVVYGPATFDLPAMLAMREKQIRQLVAPGTINAKLSAGTLVDCEYLVQSLQLRYGAEHPALRTTNTRAAMAALKAAGIVTPEEVEQLRTAHDFFRRLINALRVVRGNARDLTVPPVDSIDFGFLAKRLRYGSDVETMKAELSQNMGNTTSLVANLM